MPSSAALHPKPSRGDVHVPLGQAAPLRCRIELRLLLSSRIKEHRTADGCCRKQRASERSKPSRLIRDVPSGELLQQERHRVQMTLARKQCDRRSHGFRPPSASKRVCQLDRCDRVLIFFAPDFRAHVHPFTESPIEGYQQRRFFRRFRVWRGSDVLRAFCARAHPITTVHSRMVALPDLPKQFDPVRLRPRNPPSGRRGRGFKSPPPDQTKSPSPLGVRAFV